MDDLEYLRTQALLLIIARTVKELDLEGLLKSIERFQGEAHRDLSVSRKGPHDLSTMKAIVLGAMAFQKALPEKPGG